jgi:GT2 family glycosyltransferase
MKISIIVITHQNLNLIQQCLEYISNNADIFSEIIVVDNESTVETTAFLQGRQNVHVITNFENNGIARSFNQGIKVANGDYVLLMRQYSVLSENALNSMLKCLQSEPQAAIVGPVSNDVSGHQYIPVPYRDLKGMPEFARQNHQNNLGLSKQVFRLLSHCMLAKKKVLDELMGFDENFELETYEDDDLCWRVINLGYDLYIALDAFQKV